MSYRQRQEDLDEFHALVAAEAIRAAAEAREPRKYWLDDSRDPFETERDAEIFGQMLDEARAKREEAARSTQ